MINELVTLARGIDPELIGILLTFIVGLTETGRRFQKTGNIPYRKLPWAAKRELFRWIRKSYFTVDKPDHPSFVVDKSVDEIRKTLARQGFVPEWPLSYKYGGEDGNLRQYIYDSGQDLPNRQVHVRLFEVEGGTEIMAHSEPTPEHHPEEHLAETDMVFESANDFVRSRLEDPRPIGYPSD
ncbi:hypothetical protein [Natrialba taiwanensis]|uniref:Uncharacterized protein n=1 Tax=Natrialba taiwanensis DSM 12281 TaxID=1230458 RepID=L9ZY39_9EURY|nr:hypothetical protein [Natrialba taiwanensis]ELY91425.1 hypothetical protein C484_10371 [Natrialba taiwanensis DSM 12281]